MSGQRAHPHISDAPFTPYRPIPTLPANVDDYIDQVLESPPPRPALLDFDTSFTTQPTMATVEQQLQQLRDLASAQQQQIAAQQKQMEDAAAQSDLQTQQLMESKRQLEASQQSVSQLTDAFRQMSTSRPLTISTTPKKKPDLPPFDAKNVLVWIRRVESAYARAGVVESKDKFAWMESVFTVKMDPQIDAYLYGANSDQDWLDFIAYLKFRYGPTVREKAQKMLSDIPRHDMTPSQYLLQLTEDTKDVTVDQIRREHLLKTIPPRIREIMGKEVETMTAEEVAKTADTFFDRQGRLLEKAANPINNVTTAPPPSSTSSSSSASNFTSLFGEEEDTDVNFVRNGFNRGNERGRSRGRFGRSNSRPPINRFPNASSAGQNQGQNQSTFPKGTCRWHRKFGDKSLKCATDCPRYKTFTANQSSGNGQGGRRL